jgi:hypothetical protein
MGAHVSRNDFEWSTVGHVHSERRLEILSKLFNKLVVIIF